MKYLKSGISIFLAIVLVLSATAMAPSAIKSDIYTGNDFETQPIDFHNDNNDNPNDDNPNDDNPNDDNPNDENPNDDDNPNDDNPNDDNPNDDNPNDENPNDDDNPNDDNPNDDNPNDDNPNDDENPKDEDVIELIISLEPGIENATENWYIISRALEQATQEKKLSVKVESGGTFYVGKETGGGALKLRSNTTLDLNGSVLIRSNEMGNFFQNCDYNSDSYNGTGYSLTENITIKNGTVDGTKNVVSDINLFNFGHASGITLENLSLINCSESHLVEFTGCKDCKITGCTFKGVNNADRFDSSIEALQLDICDFDSSGKTWNGVYCSTIGSGDLTPCKNFIVDNCTFINFPAAFGNHKGIEKVVTDNVRFTNCKISTNIASGWAAVWAYDFTNSEFSKNTVSGKYTHGIRVSGGNNVTVNNNTVTTKGICVYVTVASATYKQHSNGKKIDEYTKNCNITDNTLTDEGNNNCGAISVYGASHAGNITGNTINAAKEMGITVSSKSKVDLISANEVTSPSSLGLHFSQATVKKVTGNTINAKDKAVQITSGSVVNELSSNAVKSTAEMGVSVTSKSKADLISANKITSSKSVGLHFSQATVKKVTGNTVTAKDKAVQMSSGTALGELSSNTLNSTANNALHITSSNATLVKSNTIKKCLHDSIAVISSSKVKEISSNTLAGSGENGIRISASAVTGILSNSISSCSKNAIYVSSKSKITNIKNNVIKTAKEQGIYVTSATASTINGNYCQNCKNGGIKVASSGKTTCVFGNAVHGSKDFGICLNNKSVTVKIGNNALRGNSKADFKNSGKTKKANKAGWQKITSYTYRFNAKGNTYTGFQKIKSSSKTNTYYFNKYGIMLKGWQKIKNAKGKTYTYYFGTNGIMQTGKVTIGSKTYVFKSNGICTNP